MSVEDSDKLCVEPYVLPRKLNFRPALDKIDYNIGNYSDFQRFFLQSLSKNHVLSGWTHYGIEDPGIALMEATSIVCRILTFYQDLYANETKLRTAKWRENVWDLVRLTGYRFSPGLGGKGSVVVELNGDKPQIIKEGFPIKADLEESMQPVDFESENEYVLYPWLSKFNLFRPVVPQKITKKTNEFYISSPNQDISALKLKEGDKLLLGVPVAETGYQSNPRELADAQIVIIDKIRESHGRTLFTIKGNIMREGQSDYLVGYKIGRSFNHFGSNAPPAKISIEKEKPVESKISYIKPPVDNYFDEAILYRLENVEEKIFMNPHLAKLSFALDNQVNDIPIGGLFLIQAASFSNVTNITGVSTKIGKVTGEPMAMKADTGEPMAIEAISTVSSKPVGKVSGLYMPTIFHENDALFEQHTFVRTIMNVMHSSMNWGANSGSTSIVTFDKELSITKQNETYDALDIRNIQFHEVISPILLVRAKNIEKNDVMGKVLDFYGTDKEAESLIGRDLIFMKPNGNVLNAQVSQKLPIKSDPTYSDLHTITLDQQLDYEDFPLENPIITVYGNVVDVRQGKTQNEAVLGNGDNRLSFQTFKLPKSPLTYRFTPGEHPPEIPELKIYVNNQLWKLVPSLFDRSPEEKVYIVRQDVNGDSWVQFGDGKSCGAKLPSGFSNILAVFKIGMGAYGPAKSGTSPQAGDRIENLTKIQLLGIVSGGSQPESEENAKNAAPGKVQSLGRIVSIQDFESEAKALSGVSKASAIWALENNIPTIIITILMENGREKEFDNISKDFRINDRIKGMQRHPISVHQASLQDVSLDLEYGYDSTFRKDEVEKAIKLKLGVSGEKGLDGSAGLFGIQNRTFGENEYVYRIEGTVQNTPGVIWVKVKNLVSEENIRKPLLYTVPFLTPIIHTVPFLTPIKRSLLISKRNFSSAVCKADSVLTLNVKNLNMNGFQVELNKEN